MGTADLTARRVTIQHDIAAAADRIAAEYQLLADDERAARLVVALDAVPCQVARRDALVRLAGEAQAWLEALAVEEAR